MDWKVISLLLCTFVFFKEFRPNEPFGFNYLLEYKNFTREEVNQEIYPVNTYCHLISLVFVFLVTDIIRYKPMLIICGISGIITFVLLIVAKTVSQMQVQQFFYGFFLTPEIAHYAYIFAKVDKMYYQKVTAFTKAATLLGKLFAGITAQLTVSLHLLDYHQLNYVTLGAVTICTIWAMFLPTVKSSTYFHQSDDQLTDCERRSSRVNKYDQTGYVQKYKRAYALLWRHFLRAYADTHVLKWSFWWAFATCGFLQEISYVQLLWEDTTGKTDSIYNGAVDTILTVAGAATVIFIGWLKVNWELYGEAMLSFFSFIEGILMIVASSSHNIWVLYTIHILFGIIYHSVITVANFEVAKRVSEDSHGLIFGINIWFTLLLQSLLTFVIAGKWGLTLDIRNQYMVIGGYFVTIGSIFLVMGIYTLSSTRRQQRRS